MNTPRRMAMQVAQGFRAHDAGDREMAVESFAFVDRHQFVGLNEQESRDAAEAYVDALFAKDAVEEGHAEGGTVAGSVADEDWSPVRDALARRAYAVGMPESYADYTTEAWRAHKTGGDYWTPMMRAQEIEVRAATGNPDYPEKPSDGLHGPGALPAMYLVGVELHDLHTEQAWRDTVEVMQVYFRRVLEAHG